LGWDSTDADASTWRLARKDKRPLRWFQDALDFGYRYRLSTSGAKPTADAKGYGFINEWRGEAAGIKVPGYLARSGLVAKSPTEVSYFLSEALAALGGDLRGVSSPRELVHYFVPLAGLSQWRATACWIRPVEAKLGDAKTGDENIVNLGLRQALDEVFTQSVISSSTAYFAHALSRPSGEERLSVLCDAICSLWWADAVLLYSGDDQVYAEYRDETGNLRPTAPSRREMRLPQEEHSPQSIWNFQAEAIRIDFAELSGSGREVVRGILGCDRAVVRLRLLEQDAEKANLILKGVEEQLAQSLGGVLHLHRMEAAERDKRKLQEAMSAYASIAHELNKLFDKQFKHVPVVLRSGSLNENDRSAIVFAWEVLGSAVEVSYYLGKARITSRRDQRQELFRRFREPIARLWRKDELEAAIRTVAKRVYEREGPEGRRLRRIPALEGIENTVCLAADEFARCYVLCAEPIRNFLTYGPRGEASWAVAIDSRKGIAITLIHSVRLDTYDLPESPTFDALAAFLGIDPVWECRAICERVEDGRDATKVRWTIELGCSFLGEENEI